jgi:hypothetical protein
MYARFEFAFDKALRSLRAALSTQGNFGIVLAFLLTLIGFVGMQFAIDHDIDNVFTPIIVGFATATVFFFAAVGFVTFIATLFIFVYNLTINSDTNLDLSSWKGWSYGWRIVLSFIVSGAITAAVFNLFSQGLTEFPVLKTQYLILLDAGN